MSKFWIYVGLYLTGVNERMFLMSDDAIRLDGDLRAKSVAAVRQLERDGAESFVQQQRALEEDEFVQDELF